MKYLLPAITVRFSDARQYLLKTWHPISWCGRIVSPTKKRQFVGCEKDCHWPTAASSCQLNKCHVDLIDIRPLLHIDLDADEIVIHDAGRRFVLKRFMFHDMTPVTC